MTLVGDRGLGCKCDSPMVGVHSMSTYGGLRRYWIRCRCGRATVMRASFDRALVDWKEGQAWKPSEEEA